MRDPLVNRGVTRRFDEILNPPALRLIQQMNKQMQQALNPPALRALSDMNRQIQQALNPPALRALSDMNRQIQALDPMIFERLSTISEQFSRAYGPKFSEYARGLGAAIAEGREFTFAELDEEQVGAFENEFRDLSFTPQEINALTELFKTAIYLLCAPISAVAPAVGYTIQGLVGFLLFFLALYRGTER